MNWFAFHRSVIKPWIKYHNMDTALHSKYVFGIAVIDVLDKYDAVCVKVTAKDFFFSYISTILKDFL